MATGKYDKLQRFVELEYLKSMSLEEINDVLRLQHELITELKEWQALAFKAYPNIDLDIERIIR
jgi:hypothetical protein